MLSLTTHRRAGPLLAAALLACAAAARAQEVAPPVVATPAPPPPGTVAVPPAEKSPDLLAHWALRRDYLRDRDERRAEDEEQRVRQLKDDLALDNLFGIGAALVRESQGALAAGSPALARKLCKLAVDLAPALPAAHNCLARAILAEEPGSVRAALGEWMQAVRSALDDPRIGRAGSGAGYRSSNRGLQFGRPGRRPARRAMALRLDPLVP